MQFYQYIFISFYVINLFRPHLASNKKAPLGSFFIANKEISGLRIRLHGDFLRDLLVLH